VTPPARLAAVIDILAALETTAQPADRFLRGWWGAHRYAGSKDRAAVAARLYDVLRQRALYAWRMESAEPRALVLASLRAEGLDVAAIGDIFTDTGYGPAPLTARERAALLSWDAHTDRPVPPAAAGEYPEWLEPELTRSLGEALAPEMQAMQARAPVDLRVNLLRARKEDILAGLQGLGIAAAPTLYSPFGLRIASTEGLSTLQHNSFFHDGAFEFQDEASQMAALLCGAKPGHRVLDLAAGAGGKTLALAAIMENTGEIVAFDADPARLKPLVARTRRASARIVTPVESKSPDWDSGFDIVLIDAPCSGSGTWRRNPELRWRLTPERLGELAARQADLLAEGARYVRPNGRLVYATCSLLRCENEDVIAGFTAQAQGFSRIAAADVWREAVSHDVPPNMADYLRAGPLATGTDGFFVCIMKRA
jgi:16S rRNA (cytosine967-C5)-methyltransferase